MGLDQAVVDMARLDCFMDILLKHLKCQAPMEQNLEEANSHLLMGVLGILVLGFLEERVVLEQYLVILLEQESVVLVELVELVESVESAVSGESAVSVELAAQVDFYLEVVLYQVESQVVF